MHEIRVRVRYVECDMQGHVFNGHYLTWLDMAHTEALRSTLGDYLGIVARGVEIVVAEATIRFLGSARYDDELVVGVTFRAPGTTSLTSDFTISRDGEMLAESTIRHVCVDVATHAKAPWPDWVREGIERA